LRQTEFGRGRRQNTSTISCDGYTSFTRKLRPREGSLSAFSVALPSGINPQDPGRKFLLETFCLFAQLPSAGCYTLHCRPTVAPTSHPCSGPACRESPFQFCLRSPSRRSFYRMKRAGDPIGQCRVAANRGGYAKLAALLVPFLLASAARQKIIAKRIARRDHGCMKEVISRLEVKEKEITGGA